jgi:hypothetical protein
MTKDYSKSKVYKIWSTQGDMIYIGSTTKEYLSQRMTAHRHGYSAWKKHNQKFITSYKLFDEYGVDNCFIELLEAKELKNNDEIRQLEGGYIRNMACVNKNIAGRTKQAYYQSDKSQEARKEYQQSEKYKEYSKQYYQQTKEAQKEYSKQYRLKIKLLKTNSD